MDPNSKIYYNSATKLNLPVEECKELEGFILKLGSNNYYFYNKITPYNYTSSTTVSTDKFAMNAILKAANIPVPKARKIDSYSFTYDLLLATVSDLKFPLVVKPTLYTSFGQDVICNIRNMPLLFQQCEKLRKYHSLLSIEEYHGNLQDYRVLVFKNKIIAVTERFPSAVTGNGTDTIEELIKIENIKRSKLVDFLKPIQMDFEFEQSLLTQKLTKDSIPEKGRKIVLGYVCNCSRGGTIKYRSTKMCNENKKLFLKVANILNLELTGIDVACKSLDEPIIGTNGIIIEANPCPSVRIHNENVTILIMKSFIYKHPIDYLVHLLTSKGLLSYIVILIVMVIAASVLIGFLKYF